MLPFSLRVVWFCLSFTGMMTCWAVMLSFVRAVESYWPLVYCVGCTIMHGMFCLGMIYKMEPFRMPRSFCIAQSITMGLGVFLMTGVSASFAIATTFAALKPKTWWEGGKGLMVWRRIYIYPLFVFPFLATVVQLGITLRFDSGVQRDDLHCDYSDPTCYAGIPWLVTIPCLYLSIKAILRILKTNKHLQRSRDPDLDVDIDTFTALPRRPKHVHMARAVSTSSSSPPANLQSISRQPSSPALTNATLTPRGFHMPFQPPALNLDTLHYSRSSHASDELDSPISSNFPRFANPPQVGTVSLDPDRITVESTAPPNEEWREILGASDTPDLDKASSLKWNEDGDKSESEYVKGDDGFDTEDNYSGTYPTRAAPRSLGTTSRKARRPLPTLTPAVYRIITFQLAFTIVQPLSSISTLIDVIRHKPPAPFGTQHIALLISAWGPVFIFSKWPDARRLYSLWLPWK
ncbi:hypothetical protein D9615_005027 [Tricholomella constricta]|uniref:Uncharacterized protein n=1 Tax=Tricholomella constricta TaxID=117010 RepID=A0A8H5HHF8_9AGAR|nr:hypothetical protein D9615_005027 [Tricholomella constricta]